MNKTQKPVTNLVGQSVILQSWAEDVSREQSQFSNFFEDVEDVQRRLRELLCRIGDELRSCRISLPDAYTPRWCRS